MSRPHWLPPSVWVGVTIGQWPLESWGADGHGSGEAKARTWAAENPEKRRIFCVAVPEDIVTFSAQTIPATVELKQEHP